MFLTRQFVIVFWVKTHVFLQHLHLVIIFEDNSEHNLPFGSKKSIVPFLNRVDLSTSRRSLSHITSTIISPTRWFLCRIDGNSSNSNLILFGNRVWSNYFVVLLAILGISSSQIINRLGYFLSRNFIRFTINLLPPIHSRNERNATFLWLVIGWHGSHVV